MKFMPVEGQPLNCQLPGELIRSTVIRVCSDNTAIVKLDLATPMIKIHTYQRDQLVPVRRSRSSLGQEEWRAISEAELDLAVQADEEAAEERRKAEEAERQRQEAAVPKRVQFNVVRE
jgi:hypothetical protein